MNKTISKGCLVVHGLSGTPATMKPISDALQAKGYIVHAPLLSGHGINLRTLAHSTAEQWYESLLQAYQTLQSQVDDVYFVGLSMGSILGLKLAEELNSRIKALVLLAPPIEYTCSFRYFIIPGLRYTPLRWFIHSTAKDFDKSVLNPEGREYYRANSMARIPCDSVMELLNLTKAVCKNLSKVDQPLLVLQGRKDHMIHAHGFIKIKKGVHSQKLELALLPHSSHILPLDYDQAEVIKRIVNFFETVSANDGQKW
ncbi:MAG: alpha/beta fold hydrolase [Deltaproteobacteria bacterium]|nr:alpha/beta fold hydrolase [Deltaproteobacteria bacterium]